MSGGKDSFEIKEFADVIAILKDADSCLYILIGFHLFCSLLIYASRNRINVQVLIFLSLLLLVFFSENINEIAALHFKKHQYFDSNGLYISVAFSCPILLNCLFLLANFFYKNFELMKELKQTQLKNQKSRMSKSIKPKDD